MNKDINNMNINDFKQEKNPNNEQLKNKDDATLVVPSCQITSDANLKKNAENLSQTASTDIANNAIEDLKSSTSISNFDTKHIGINLQDRISNTGAINLGLDSKETENDSSTNTNVNNFKKNKKTDIRYKETPTFNLKETLAMIILTGIVCAIASGTIINHKYSTNNGTPYVTLLKDENIQEFLDVYAALNDGYYENIDKKAAIDGAIAGLMSGAGDNYTSFLDKENADILNSSLNGKYDGIGIAINGKEPGLIEKVYANSPAKEAGLQKGDKIVTINGENIAEKSSSDIAKLIKESASKKVKLTISRNNENLDVEVPIKTLATPVVDYEVLEGNDKKVGYLSISSFSNTLAKQVESALDELESDGIESLIIDLRNNGGGLLTAAKDTASLFLEKGKAIYSLEGNDKNEKAKVYYDETSTSRNYPIVVLVNGATASASEILTAALKDSYGATTVGTTTYGKGKVQQTKKLSDGSLVKYTTSRWLTPNNECIDEYGISPDYGIELEYQYDDEKNITGYTDTQLAKARSILGLPEYNNQSEAASNNTENSDSITSEEVNADE